MTSTMFYYFRKLKLFIRISAATIQNYLKKARDIKFLVFKRKKFFILVNVFKKFIFFT